MRPNKTWYRPDEGWGMPADEDLSGQAGLLIRPEKDFSALSDEAKDGLGVFTPETVKHVPESSFHGPCCDGSEKSIWLRSSDRPGKVLESISPVGAFCAALSGEFGTPAQVDALQWLDMQLDFRLDSANLAPDVTQALRKAAFGYADANSVLSSRSGEISEIPSGGIGITGTGTDQLENDQDQPYTISDMTELEQLEHGVQAYEEAIKRHFVDPARAWDDTLGRWVLLPKDVGDEGVKIGSRVVYINPGSLDGRYPPKLSPATVLGPGKEPDTLNLFIVTGAPGFYFNDCVAYGPRPGCWIWPL